MRKQASNIEWQLAESEAEWKRPQATALSASEPGTNRRLVPALTPGCVVAAPSGSASREEEFWAPGGSLHNPPTYLAQLTAAVTTDQ